MPNVRAKNKVYLGGYVTKDLQAEIVRRAKAAGMENNKFGYVTLLVQDSLKRGGVKVAPAPKAPVAKAKKAKAKKAKGSR